MAFQPRWTRRAPNSPAERPAAPHSTRTRGQRFEALAEAHLVRAGCVVQARNHRCRGGEIDLVVLDGEALAFVEVRYRRSRSHGGAAASVDARKRARIVRAASHFLHLHPAHAARRCRFDVVAIDGDGEARTVAWIAGAFSA